MKIHIAIRKHYLPFRNYLQGKKNKMMETVITKKVSIVLPPCFYNQIRYEGKNTAESPGAFYEIWFSFGNHG
ncbi:MAG TPA: hypothetical protein PL045_11730 [Chitinophagaceae bacterium]|nr:hypothetical protein [Chitinophagaceae bacterium]